MATEPKKEKEAPVRALRENDVLDACHSLAEELTIAAQDPGETFGNPPEVGECADVLTALALHRIANALEALQSEATDVLIEETAHVLGPVVGGPHPAPGTLDKLNERAEKFADTVRRGAKPRGG
jgi:hypothetical protein